MGLITRDFQSDNPLTPQTQSAIAELFLRDWPSPEKLHHQSRQSAIRLAQARESLASHLHVEPDQLEFVSGTASAFSLAINGLLTDSTRTFFYGAVDRRIPFAVAAIHENRGGRSKKILTDKTGIIDYESVHADRNSAGTVLAWQSINRETGIIQRSIDCTKDGSTPIYVAADMTTSAFTDLPDQWDTAIWEPASWGGPRGIGILAIKSPVWRNPGAQISHYRSAPDFSVPLVIASAIALEETLALRNDDHIRVLHESFIRELRTLTSCEVVGEDSPRDLRKLSIIVPDIEAEEALRELEKHGFLVDSGSACITPELNPSSVLAEMGYPPQGHLRITFRENQSESDCIDLARAIGAL